MRKDGVIYIDWERMKWRVCIGKRQKYHVGRYKTKKEAKAALKAALRGYALGFKMGLKADI